MLVVHDTLERLALKLPSGLGLATIDHFAPFQRSTNGRDGATAVVYSPTATQFVWVVHDTLESLAPKLPGGLWLATIDHRVPFQRSIKILGTPEAAVATPTATQLVLVMHDTLERPAPEVPGGSGLATIDQPGAAPTGTTSAIASAPAMGTAITAASNNEETRRLPRPGR